MPRPKLPKAIVPPPISLALTISGKIIHANGASTLDALNNLVIPQIKTKGILTIEKNGRKKDLYFTAFRVRKLNNPLYRAIFAKQLNLLIS